MQNSARRNFSSVVFVAAAAVLAAGAVDSLRAFTSIRLERVSAVVLVGGTPPPPPGQGELIILHDPLLGISPVKRTTIIQGEAGTNPRRNRMIDFPNRITPFGTITPQAGDPTVKVTVRFRHVEPGVAPTSPTVVELDPVQGFDPVPFAFQITPSSVTFGTIEYQIFAEKFVQQGTATVRVATATFPSADALDPWFRVGVDASASEVIGPAGGKVVIRDGNPNDGETVLSVPAGLLREPITVTVNEVEANNPFVPQPQGFQPVAIYRFDTQVPFQGHMQLQVLYPDFVFPFGQDGVLDGSSESESIATIFWWDGFSWRRVGGRLDGNANLLNAPVGGTGFYAIAAAAPASAQSARPAEKIITPNGDGPNDKAYFTFDTILGNQKVDIYDMTGHRVRSISGTGTIFWDGRDDSGDVVESGVYLYQYNVDGTLVSGVIAVAK